MPMIPPIPLPLAELVPPPGLFVHHSRTHGQAHVARVLVHAFRLIEATGLTAEAPRLWAAVYLHDLARTHDGRCERHGSDAVEQFGQRADLRELFARGGVMPGDYEAIGVAVSVHSRPPEPGRDHPHWTLIGLLKDADGLDRVRIHDLDARYLRFAESRAMIPFAWQLLEASWCLEPGPDYFAQLWPRAVQLLHGPA